MLGDELIRLDPHMNFSLVFCIALLPTFIRAIKQKPFIL